jgi:hypothetical protein
LNGYFFLILTLLIIIALAPFSRALFLCEIERLKRDSLKTDTLQHHKQTVTACCASGHNHGEAPTMSATYTEVQCCLCLWSYQRKAVDAELFLDN